MQSFTSAIMRIFARPLERFGFTFALLLAMSHGLWAHDFKVGEIEIAHPWSRAAPQGAKVAGGFVVLKNHGPAADRLVAVTADIARKAEIHEMAVDDQGVMKMRPLANGLEIPAGGEVSLKPGGFHIMFMDLERTPKQGETFKGTLTFEKAGAVDVEFTVDAMAGNSKGHGGGGSHGG